MQTPATTETVAEYLEPQALQHSALSTRGRITRVFR